MRLMQQKICIYEIASFTSRIIQSIELTSYLLHQLDEDIRIKRNCVEDGNRGECVNACATVRVCGCVCVGVQLCVCNCACATVRVQLCVCMRVCGCEHVEDKKECVNAFA